MSAKNDDDKVYLCCDDCGQETPVFDSDEFRDLVMAARLDGWLIAQKGGIWTHLCHDCNGHHARIAKARAKFGMKES